MATKTFYAASGNDGNFGALVDGVAQTAASRADGWTVAKLAVNNQSDFDAGTKQLSSTFAVANKPAGLTLGTTANAFKTPSPLTGTFAVGTWNFFLVVRATLASSQSGLVSMRVFKSTNADGSGATQLTSALQVSGGVTGGLSTTADASTFVNWSPGTTITLSNEYLFFAISWTITTAAGSNSADVVLRTGSTGPAGTRIVTPDFAGASLVSLTGLASPQTFGTIAVALGPVSRTMVGLSSPQAFGSPTFTVRGPPQTVQVPGVYPPGAVYQASITGAVIVGDGHVVGGGWSYAAQFGTVTARIVTAAPIGGVSSAQAFGAATPSTRVTVSVIGRTSAQAFGSLAFRVTLGSGGVLSAQAFGVPVPKATIARAITGVNSAQQFGTVTVTTVTRPAAGGVPTAQAFGTVTPVVTGGGAQTAVVTGLGSAQSFGAATVKTLTTRQVSGITSAQQFGVPTTRAVVTRTVGSVSAAQSFGTATVRAVITRAITGVNSAQSFGVPTAANIVTPQTVPVGSVPSAQRFGVAGYPQTVSVQGVNPYLVVTSITGQVICGDGHLVGTSVYALGMFGAVGVHTTVTRQVGGVSSTAVVGVVRATNILKPNGVLSAQQFGVAKALPGPVRLQLSGIPSAQLFGHVTPHRYDLHVNCKPDGGFTMPPSTTGGFVLTPITEGGFVLNPVSDTTFTLTPSIEGDFVITAVDEDG